MALEIKHLRGKIEKGVDGIQPKALGSGGVIGHIDKFNRQIRNLLYLYANIGSFQDGKTQKAVGRGTP
jgi:hypothetical protein